MDENLLFLLQTAETCAKLAILRGKMSSKKSNYTETKREKFGISEITRRYDNGDVEKRLEEFDWCKRKQVMRNRKVIHPDGSSEEYNFQNKKSVETLADGTIRQFFSVGNIKSERLPNGTERWFYDDGKISMEVDANGVERLYYKNGALMREDDYAERRVQGFAEDGTLNYAIKNKEIYINSAYFSYYRIGVKTDIITEHWAEEVKLNPHKKILLCLGGSATEDARAANGNINAMLDAFGFSGEECESIQLAACYRPTASSSLELALRKYEVDCSTIKEENYQREVQRVFMPFMAQKHGQKYIPLSEKELFVRFRNIMLFTHCFGANDLPIIEKTLKNTMSELGYGKLVQKYALRQILCITNNNQREFSKDRSDMTIIHRYSVWDGQRSPQYNLTESADYGVFLNKYQPFYENKGSLSGLVNLRKNEVLFICDKVLKDGDEHNYGFFTQDRQKLTNVGQWQAKIMQKIGKYWLKNKKAIPSASELILQSVGKDVSLQRKIQHALIVGKKTQRAKINPIKNPAIIDVVYKEYLRVSAKNANRHPLEICLHSMEKIR